MRKYYERKAIQQPDNAVGDLIMLNAKNIWTKTTNQKVKPKALWRFQSNGKKWELGIQTRNIPAMEDISNIPCVAVRTISTVKSSRKATTPART